MRKAEVFSQAFAEEQLSHLQWKEVERHSFKELHGKFYEEHPEYLPKDILTLNMTEMGDEFYYCLETHFFKTWFNRHFFNTTPVSTYLALSFDFGETRNPKSDTELIAPSYRHVHVTFYDGWPGNGVYMFSQNLELHHRDQGWGSRNRFTDYGREFMEKLLAEIKKIPSISGLITQDRNSLVKLVEDVEKKYRANELEPMDQIHT